MIKNETINEILSILNTLYEGHIESFNQADLPDLEKQSMERKKILKLLIKNEELLISRNGIQEISTLIHNNKLLHEKACLKRELLRKNIKKIATGKQALAKYGQVEYKSKIPRVVSLKS